MTNEENSEKFKGVSTIDAIRRMAELKKQKDGLDAQVKDIVSEYDFLRLVLIPERFDAEGISNMKIDGVGRVNLRGDVYVSVLAENREQFYGWLRDTGRGSLIQDNVNPSTLKAAAKEWMRSGEEIPEELIKITPYTQSVITKS